jgi:hypothetical protein
VRYESQSNDELGRLRARLRAILARLDLEWDTESPIPPFPERRKSMQWRTYDRLRGEFVETCDELETHLIARGGAIDHLIGHLNLLWGKRVEPEKHRGFPLR